MGKSLPIFNPPDSLKNLLGLQKNVTQFDAPLQEPEGPGDGRTVDDFKPYLVALNLTKRCNLKCDHCYLDATTKAVSAVAGLGDLTLLCCGATCSGAAEEAAMAECLRDRVGLAETEAQLVAEIARGAAERLAGVEDYLLTRGFNERATAEEKEALLDCLYAVAGADGTISRAEDDEIKQIANALLVPHRRVMDIRAGYRDQLGILRDLPEG